MLSLAAYQGDMMDKAYWIGRKRAAIAMARAATSAEARLVHYDLAGRYSVNAACAPVPAGEEG